MIIEKNFGLWWETTSKLIQNDYKINIRGLKLEKSTLIVKDDKNNMVLSTSYFFADTIVEIENKIKELGLIFQNIEE